jgi:hypothetical protein
MRRLVFALAVPFIALATVAVALGAVEDRVGIRINGGNDTAKYSPSLMVRVLSPPDYRRGCCYDSNGGEWLGPRYQATGLATLGADASIDWALRVHPNEPDTRKAIIAKLVHNWPVTQEGSREVEHFVGGRPAGTIPATWLLTRSTFYGTDDAAYESAVGFQLCGNVAVVRFGLLKPSGDSAGGTMGYGEFKINGQNPTDWNRQQALTALEGVRLEGNLPTGRVSAKATGRRVSGRVTDCQSHAVAGAKVELQKRVGRRWARVAGATSSATGAFTLRARGAGTHRVVSGSRASGSFRVR